ncbi:hypothetical protein J6590_040767 [Homalodisca vitripennis]|nr:hypothetical protein J6590_040767 [Homalodisca vitripennis]
MTRRALSPGVMQSAHHGRVLTKYRTVRVSIDSYSALPTLNSTIKNKHAVCVSPCSGSVQVSSHIRYSRSYELDTITKIEFNWCRFVASHPKEQAEPRAVIFLLQKAECDRSPGGAGLSSNQTSVILVATGQNIVHLCANTRRSVPEQKKRTYYILHSCVLPPTLCGRIKYKDQVCMTQLCALPCALWQNTIAGPNRVLYTCVLYNIGNRPLDRVLVLPAVAALLPLKGSISHKASHPDSFTEATATTDLAQAL